MANLQNLEMQAQQAILCSMVEIYKQRQINWLNQPAIKKAILMDALCGWQNLTLITVIILASSVLPTIFNLTQVITVIIVLAIVLLGLFVEILWLWVSFKDKQRQTKALVSLLQHQVTFSLDTIRDKGLRAKLYKALQYWSLINDTTDSIPQGVLYDRVLRTNRDVTQWLQAVYTLANRTDKLWLNLVIRHDLQNIPGIIQKYEQKLQQENNSQVRQQLEQALAHRQQQLHTLQTLQNNIKQAHHQLDHTLSALGMIYSQLLLIVDKGQQGNRVSRLQTEVSEEIHRLQDLTEAMNEVYQEATYASPETKPG